jgi:hypothetical protein
VDDDPKRGTTVDEPGRADVAADQAGVVQHRADVVRRLLERGMSVAGLRALFPAWDDLITSVAVERDARADRRRGADARR